MIKIFFVRHAQPDHDHADDKTRPLTDEGMRDAELVTDFFKNQSVHAFYCSPYKRSIDTIAKSAQMLRKQIVTDARLREREKGPGGNAHSFFQKRWDDLAFHEEGGESIAMVQKRNIKALHEIMQKHDGETVVIGTHGTALSSILKYYDASFGHIDFLRILDWMPYIIELQIENDVLLSKTEHLHCEKRFLKNT